MADERNQLAESRTDLAEDRTVLANERTFAGWMRTGLSAVGIALGFHALFNRMEPDWVPRIISTIFLLAALFVFWSSERRAAAVCKRLDAHNIVELRSSRLRLLTIVMSAATLALIGAIWLLPLSPR
jgi:putative membrane protein